MKGIHSAKFVSIWKKFLRYCIVLGVGLLISGLLSQLSMHIFYQKGDFVLEMSEHYSLFWNQMSGLNRSLFSYAQVSSDQTAEEIEENLAEMKLHSEAMVLNIEDQRFYDLWILAQKYEAQCREVIREASGEMERMAAYSNAERLWEELESLKKSYDDSLDMFINRQRSWLNEIRWRFMVVCSLISVIIFLMFLFNTGIIYRKIMEPVAELTQQSKKIIGGNPDIELLYHDEESDELDILNNVFYQMVETNNRNMAELRIKSDMEQKLAKTEVANAQLQARLDRTSLRLLQSRITPHFMFNMLNIVAGLAVDEDADRTAKFTLKMAKYLRYSLVSLDKVVRLEDEFENSRLFLEIQKERFQERLEITLYMSGECADFHIPSMILQPLCENAIIHGMAPLVRPVKVKVQAEKQGDTVVLSVEDNGAGISEENLHQLLEDLTNWREYDDTRKIGVGNTFQRLQMYYGGKAGFAVESVPDERTVFRFMLPTDSRETEKDGENESSIGG